MKIKLCGVRTVPDALLCAREGADEIGVVFAERSRRRVTVEEAKAIRDALPAGVPLVGVFLDAELSEVLRIAGEVGLQAAQLHGKWPAERTALALYAALQVDSEESLRPRPGGPSAVRRPRTPTGAPARRARSRAGSNRRRPGGPRARCGPRRAIAPQVRSNRYRTGQGAEGRLTRVRLRRTR